MALAEYRKKRDFSKTREPSGAEARGTRDGEGRYSMQKHDARRLHYDLRLAHGGVLLSWAIPKGPSVDPADKRLAVRTEDHPMAYADFEGTIPKGEYGAGTVLLWDSGTWEPRGDVDAGLKRGKLEFELRGEKLQGRWHLQRLRGRDTDAKENWLLIKGNDAHAVEGEGDRVVTARTESVRSGRGLEAIERGDAPLSGGVLPSAEAAPFPSEIRPQLATLADAPPEGAHWVHETKYDGYRLLAYCGPKGVVLRTRNGHDWTDRFGVLERALGPLCAENCVLDGELIALDDTGREDFQILQNALKDGKAGNVVLRFMAFDLPYAQGYALDHTPLTERKHLLQLLLGGVDSETVRYSDHISLSGKQVWKTACEMGLEGIISKRSDAGYQQRRSRDWLKSKCSKRQEFVIGGYTDPSGARSGLGALLLGYYEEGRLKYAGKVGTGFNDRTLSRMGKDLAGLEVDAPAYDEVPAQAQRRGVHWVRPERVAEVKFTGWTQDRHLRHPVFVGLRADKPPQEVTVEVPEPVAEAETDSGASFRADPAARQTDVPLTNPDRVFYPEIDATKRQLAAYYEAVAQVMLPYVAKRPLSLVRHPKGWRHKGFFQKHIDDTFPDAVQRVGLKDKRGEGESAYGYVKDADGLVGLLQMGTLEIHNWGSRIDAVDKPDLVIMDLDPSDAVGAPAVLGAAFMLRDILKAVGLTSFLKTTGGKGFHVVLPIRRGPGWDAVKEFARQLGERLQQENPDAFTLKASKQARRGKIYIDYLRNGRGATAIAPFSTRARECAPVAVPIAWDEADSALRPDQYTLQNTLRRLSHLRRDPWEGFFDVRQGLTKKVKAALASA